MRQEDIFLFPSFFHHLNRSEPISTSFLVSFDTFLYSFCRQNSLFVNKIPIRCNGYSWPLMKTFCQTLLSLITNFCACEKVHELIRSWISSELWMQSSNSSISDFDENVFDFHLTGILVTLKMLFERERAKKSSIWIWSIVIIRGK